MPMIVAGDATVGGSECANTNLVEKNLIEMVKGVGEEDGIAC